MEAVAHSVLTRKLKLQEIFRQACKGFKPRFKCKLQEIWTRILSETYTEADGSKEEFMEANALRFADDPQPETEADNLMAMLEDMLNPQEELDSVKSEGKAPSYSGKQLSANNEKSTVDATKYEVKHTSTKTPGDSKTSVKSIL